MTVVFIILLCIGLAAGILSGFVGIGGGIVIVPSLIFLIGLSQYEAQGTSLALMLPPIGILAAYNYYKNGNLNIRYAAIIAVAFVFGGFIGSKTALSLNAHAVREIFASVLLLLSLKYIFSK
ncbi:MAG: sulfite exporter TauE/SafE family protein [Bacteroidia bacterium]